MPPIDAGILSKIGLGLQSSGETFDVLTARSTQYIPDIKKYAARERLNVKKIQAVGGRRLEVRGHPPARYLRQAGECAL